MDISNKILAFFIYPTYIVIEKNILRVCVFICPPATSWKQARCSAQAHQIRPSAAVLIPDSGLLPTVSYDSAYVACGVNVRVHIYSSFPCYVHFYYKAPMEIQIAYTNTKLVLRNSNSNTHIDYIVRSKSWCYSMRGSGSYDDPIKRNKEQ